MDFAIEMPAEANPLTIQILLNVLQSASSNDQQQVTTATQQLQNWELTPGFFSLLQSLYNDYSLPLESRYLAIIQFKNGIDKYWRKTAKNALSNEEKALIRSRLIQSAVNEPDRRLALQLGVVSAKIIRFDYPKDWPDPIILILEKLGQTSQLPGNSVDLSRSLLLLLYVIKELLTLRLPRARKSFLSATPDLVRSLSSIYTNKVKIWLLFIEDGDDEGGALGSIEQSLLALRCLRRLLIAGYEHPERHIEVKALWMGLNSDFSVLTEFIHCRTPGIQMQTKDLILKHAIQIAKLHVDMVTEHPAGFVSLPNATELAVSYWEIIQQLGQVYSLPSSSLTTGDAIEEPSGVQKFLILKGLLLLRAFLRMSFNPPYLLTYQQSLDKEEKLTIRDFVRDELFTEALVCEAMETLVSCYFVITPQDLKEWEEEPEEWEKAQEGAGEDWELSIRTCSEKLFMDLINNYKSSLVQRLLTAYQAVAGLEVKDKESVYTAIGIAAPVLYFSSDFDFGHFLETVLKHEVQITEPGYNILRRRAAILLGRWLPIQEGLNRPLVYEIFRYLLDRNDPQNDEVVRITAGRQLKNVIDPFEFSAEPFIPYANDIIERLTGLVHEVGLPETKLTMLDTLNVIFTKMEQQITPFADQIMSFLPPLWNNAGDEYLIKQTILSILTTLCTSMQGQSRRYHPLIVPLIDSSVEASSTTHIYLLEEALDLWAAVIEQTTSESVPSEVILLVRHIPPLFEIGTENLKKILEITEAYIYLIPLEMLSNSVAILNPLAVLLGTLKREATGFVTALVELLIQSADSLRGQSGVEELTGTLISSNMLNTLVCGLYDAYVAHQTTGPNKKSSQIDGPVETDHFNVLARIAISSPSLLLSVLDSIATIGYLIGSSPIKDTILWLLDEWFSHIDDIGHPESRKLNCLALTSLFETGEPFILGRLQSLMSVWTDVINKIVEDFSVQAGVKDMRDSLVIQISSPADLETPAGRRRRQLNFSDPVHRNDIRGVIRASLLIVVEKRGGMEIFQREWLVNVDQHIVDSFSALGIV